MSKKLFVGNLSFKVTGDQLRDLFAQFGDVEEAVVISDKFSGRSRGFGFVTMINDAEAEKAIDELNGKEFDGREIVVNEARPPRQDNRGPRN